MSDIKLRPDTLLASDSVRVKRSKLMGCGIKPIEGREISLTSLIIEYAKKHFKNVTLKDYTLEELFEESGGSSNKFIKEKESIFGKIIEPNELFELDSVSVDFINRNSIEFKEKFSDFITEYFSTKEVELLETAYLFEVYKTLAKFEFKSFFSIFLKHQIEKEPYKQWFTYNKDLIIIRNNISVRELEDYLSYTYMLLPLKKVNVVNLVMEEMDEFLTEIFLEKEELPKEEEVEFMKELINDFLPKK